jgi:hypothetical protein
MRCVQRYASSSLIGNDYRLVCSLEPWWGVQTRYAGQSNDGPIDRRHTFPPFGRRPRCEHAVVEMPPLAILGAREPAR